MNLHRNELELNLENTPNTDQEEMLGIPMIVLAIKREHIGFIESIRY